MQRAGEALRTAGHAVADRTGEAARAVGERVGEAKDATSERAHEAADALRAKVADARVRLDHAREDVRVKAQAIGETGRRAKRAPGRIAYELGEAFLAWRRGLMARLAGLLAMGVVSLGAFIVLTIALVVGLNELLFDPAGTFVVAGLYGLLALAAYGLAKGARARAAQRSHERIENAKEELRHVGRPVREAFARRGPGA